MRCSVCAAWVFLFSFMLSLPFTCFCGNQCYIATDRPITELDPSAFLSLHLSLSPQLTCLPVQTETVSKELLCRLSLIVKGKGWKVTTTAADHACRGLSRFLQLQTQSVMDKLLQQQQKKWISVLAVNDCFPSFYTFESLKSKHSSPSISSSGSLEEQDWVPELARGSCVSSFNHCTL